MQPMVLLHLKFSPEPPSEIIKVKCQGGWS